MGLGNPPWRTHGLKPLDTKHHPLTYAHNPPWLMPHGLPQVYPLMPFCNPLKSRGWFWISSSSYMYSPGIPLCARVLRHFSGTFSVHPGMGIPGCYNLLGVLLTIFHTDTHVLPCNTSYINNFRTPWLTTHKMARQHNNLNNVRGIYVYPYAYYIVCNTIF